MRHRRARERDAAQRVLGGVLVDLDHRGRGSVTAIVGGFAKRRTWHAEVGAEDQDPDRHEGQDDDDRREGQALAGRAIGRGTAIAGVRLARVAALAPPLLEDLVGIEPEVQRVVAQEALRVDGARELLVVAALEAPRGSARGSSCRAPPGTGRRPCARGRRTAAPAGSTGRARVGAMARAARSGRPGPLASELVPRRHSLIPVRVRRPRRRARRRRVATEHRPGVRAVERPDVPARLQLVDHPGGPRIADLQAALEERRRGPIVLPNDLDGIRQQAIGVLVGEVVDASRSPRRRSR